MAKIYTVKFQNVETRLIEIEADTQEEALQKVIHNDHSGYSELLEEEHMNHEIVEGV